MEARDSLRTEAGLPRFGHELAGPLGLDPADAGFDPYVKLYKPFFVGKAAYLARERARSARLARFQVVEPDARVPQQGDPVVSREGRVVGAVTSGTTDTEGRLCGLCHLEKRYSRPGTRLAIFRVDDETWASKPLSSLRMGDLVQLHEDMTIVKRFLNKVE
jgi:glycine hydroxymethyltransferase